MDDVICASNSDCAEGYICGFDLSCLAQNNGQGLAFGCNKVCFSINGCTDETDCDVNNGETCVFWFGDPSGYCHNFQ